MSKSKKSRIDHSQWEASKTWLESLIRVPSNLASLEVVRDFLNSANTLAIDLYNLPKFGGFKPGCSGGAFSWDLGRVLTWQEGVGYFIVSREDFDITDVELSDLAIHEAVLT